MPSTCTALSILRLQAGADTTSAIPRRGARTFITVITARRGSLARQVITLEPPAEPVETRKQRSLVDIGLIELVAHLPLELGRNHDAPDQFSVLPKPVVQAHAGVGHDGEEGELVE